MGPEGYEMTGVTEDEYYGRQVQEEEWVTVARDWANLWDDHTGDAEHQEAFEKAHPGWDVTAWFSDLNRLNSTDDVMVKFRKGYGYDFYVHFEASEDGPFWLVGKTDGSDHAIYTLTPPLEDGERTSI